MLSSLEQRRAPYSPYVGPAIIVAWATMCFWPVLFGHRVLFWHDASIFNLPLRAALRQSTAHGHLPLWSWSLGGGYPVACDPQSGLLYPLQALDLTGLVSIERMYGISAWLHFIIAALGAAALAGMLGLHAISRILAGLTYAGSGFLAGHVMHEHLVWAAAWLPWAFAALLWLWRQPSVFRAAVSAIPLGLALLAGHPQIALYIFAAYAFWAAAGPIVRPNLRRPQALAWALVSALAGATLGIGPYIASLDLVAESLRRTTGPAGAGIFDMALDPPYWPLIFHPFLYGSYAENNYFGGAHHYEVCGYVAAPAILLAAAALLATSQKHRTTVWAALGLAVLAFAMAAARQNPLYHLLSSLPFVQSFRAHARWVMVMSLGISLLAAVGLETLMTTPRRHFLLPIGLITLGLWGLAPLALQAARAPAIRVLAASAPKESGVSREAKAAEKYQYIVRRISWVDPYWLGYGLSGVALLVITAVPSARTVALGFLVAAVAIQGALYVSSYLPSVPPEYYRAPPHTAMLIARTPGLVWVDPQCAENQRPPRTYRGWTHEGTQYYMAERAVLRPNRSVLWGIPGARCVIPLAPFNQVQVLDELVPSLLADPRKREAGYRLLASIGIKWVIAPPDHAPPGEAPVARTPFSALYRVTGACPTVRMIGGKLVTVSPGPITPAQATMLSSAEDALVASPAGPARGDGRLTSVRQLPYGSVRAVAYCRRLSLVSLGVTLYRAHRATVDGRPVPLVTVNGYLAGVWVPPGHHTVELTYDYSRLWQGITLYLAAWVSLFIVLFAGIASQRLAARRLLISPYR